MAEKVQPKMQHHFFLPAIYLPESQTVGDKRITLKENHDMRVDFEGKAAEYHTVAQGAFRMLRSSEGIFRGNQAIERLSKFTNEVRATAGYPRFQSLDICAPKANTAWTFGTTIFRAIDMTPGVIGEVKEAAQALGDPTLSKDQLRYKVTKGFREFTDAIAMYYYSAATVFSLFPKLNQFNAASMAVAETVTFAHDTTALSMNVENYARARQVDLSDATDAIKETVEQTKTYTMLATMKDVASFVSGFFTVLYLSTGAALLPGLAAVTLSLASTVFAIARKLYQETMPYKPIDFLDNRSVSLVTV